MKQWWMWFLLSGIWLLVTVLNALDGRNGIVIGYNVLATLIFAALGVAQRLCEQKGDAGKRIFNLITIAAIALILVVFLLILILF